MTELTPEQIEILDDLVSDLGWDASDVGDAQSLLVSMKNLLALARTEITTLKARIAELEVAVEWKVWKAGEFISVDNGIRCWVKPNEGSDWVPDRVDSDERYLEFNFTLVTNPAARDKIIATLPEEVMG